MVTNFGTDTWLEVFMAQLTLAFKQEVLLA